MSPDARRLPAIWLVGLPRSGKTIPAALVGAELTAAGLRSCVLDDDMQRTRLNPDLERTATGDAEAARRMG